MGLGRRAGIQDINQQCNYATYFTKNFERDEGKKYRLCYV